MNPQRYHSVYPVDRAFPGEQTHPQFYPTSPQANHYAPLPSPQHFSPSSLPEYAGEHSFMRAQGQRLVRHEHQFSAHSSLPERECLQCGQKFYSEVERDQHLFVCLRQEPEVPDEPFYESIDNPLPTVLLIWSKERQTLEKEVQLYTKEGEAINLAWSDEEARFQAETRMSVGEHDGLLSVNDINLSVDVHTFYVADIQRNAKMQRIELAIDDEAEELKEREEPVFVEEVVDKGHKGDKGDKGEEEKAKKPKNLDLKKKLSKIVGNNLDGEWNARDAQAGEAKKQIRSLQKENEKHSQREAELREQNKKLSADCSKYKKHVETLSKSKEDKRSQLEAEKQVLTNTISALKKKLELSQTMAESPVSQELNAALEKRKSLLDVRERENTDLSQQLANFQMITSVQENQLKDQQEEIVEKRERVAELEARLQRLQKEFARKEEVWLQESERCKEKLSECTVKSGIELDQAKKELKKFQITCESLRREKERLLEGALLQNVAADKSEPRVEQAQLQVAPPVEEREGEETEVKALKRQLLMVEKEKDELVLVKKACELDLERLRERSKLGNESKTEQRAPQDPEISKFFQNTIKRKEEELEETKQSLTALREQNLRLESERDAYFQQVESYKGDLIPSLEKQIRDMQEYQLLVATAARLSCVEGSLTASCDEAQLLSPASPAVESEQQKPNGTAGPASIPIAQTCSQDTVFKHKISYTPNSPAPAPPAAPSVPIQELPLPLHLQKQPNPRK